MKPVRSFALMSALGTAALLGGCEFSPPQYGLYVPESTRDQFQVIAFVPCWLRIEAVPTGRYYVLTGIAIGPAPIWNYDVRFVGDDGKSGYARVTFTFRQDGDALESSAAPGAGFPGACAALVQLPWPAAGKPFELPDTAGNIRERAQPFVEMQPWLLAAQVALLAVCVWLGWFGVRTAQHPVLRFIICAASAAAVVLGSELTALLCIFWRWQAINQTLDFQAFVQSLPRSAAGMLPLSGSQVEQLLAGASHSPVFDLQFPLYAWVAGGSTALWLLLHAAVMCRGVYWVCASLPTERVWRRAMAEGREASPSELWGALEQTVLNKAPWQIDIQRKKASEFMRKLNSDTQGGDGQRESAQTTDVLPVASHTDVISQVQRRITDASNVTGFFESLGFEARADNAAHAMRAQVVHAQAVVACVDEHAKVLGAMDRFFEAALQMQMRRDLAAEIYESRATDEREQFAEAAHKRELAQLRREKERADAEREAVSARHGVEAEKKFKAVKFALGKQRLASKIAEAHVGVAVARTAAGEPSDWLPSLTANEPTEVSVLHGLIDKKQRKIEEGEADGKDTTDQRAQLAKLKDALAAISAP